MSARIRIRRAKQADIEAICSLRRASILAIPPGYYSSDELQTWAKLTPARPLANRVEAACILVADSAGDLLACAGLHLEQREIVGLFIAPNYQGRGLGRKMLTAVEKLAVQFGLLHLRASATQSAIDFYLACGYQAHKDSADKPNPHTGLMEFSMRRYFSRRQTRFGHEIVALHQQLGIPADYGCRYQLQLQLECKQPMAIGTDIFSRPQYLAAPAARAWVKMQAAATGDGIELQAVSALRSVKYQADIIRTKLGKGQSMEQVLKVSAAPGYSEHHSGRALDLTMPGFEPLQTAFEKSPAFQWLTNSADRFGFRLSYPRNNRHGLCYEPWHWRLY